MLFLRPHVKCWFYKRCFFFSCSLKRVLLEIYCSLRNQMHCVVKYIKKGYPERCGYKKAIKLEDVVKSHPRQLAMWGVLQNWEAISNKKSSGTPKPKSVCNPEHPAASDLLSWRPLHVDEDSCQPLLWHFDGWRHSLWEGLAGLKTSFKIFPILQPLFFFFSS